MNIIHVLVQEFDNSHIKIHIIQNVVTTKHKSIENSIFKSVIKCF